MPSRSRPHRRALSTRRKDALTQLLWATTSIYSYTISLYKRIWDQEREGVYSFPWSQLLDGGPYPIHRNRNQPDAETSQRTVPHRERLRDEWWPNASLFDISEGQSEVQLGACTFVSHARTACTRKPSMRLLTARGLKEGCQSDVTSDAHQGLKNAIAARVR